MKLLFDQNLSPRLVRRLETLFPGSTHVSHHELDRSMDTEIWAFAEEHGFLIVSKDADFGELGAVRGFPPKVIWLRRGNCTTDDIEKVLRENVEPIRTFDSNEKIGLLMLS